MKENICAPGKLPEGLGGLGHTIAQQVEVSQTSKPKVVNNGHQRLESLTPPTQLPDTVVIYQSPEPSF